MKENKEEDQIEIFIIGPTEVGKSQIFENFTKKEDTEFLEGREATTAARPGSVMTAKFWDVGGAPRYSGVLPGYLKRAKVVLLVVDRETLSKGEDTVSIFLQNISTYAPAAKVKIIVNKMDEDSFLTVLKEEMEKACREKIQGYSNYYLLQEKNSFNPDEDIIYYSAKDAAEKFREGSSLEQDPIIGSIQPIIDKLSAEHLQAKNRPIIQGNLIGLTSEEKLVYQATHRPIIPSIDFKAALDLEEQKSLLIFFGKILLFILFAAALTAVFGAIGFGIGLAAGAWTGPGAFVTAIAGAFAGAATAWNLAVLIAAPVLGFAFTSIGFGLWHRASSGQLPAAEKVDDITANDIEGSFIANPEKLDPVPYQEVLGASPVERPAQTHPVKDFFYHLIGWGPGH